MATILDCFLFAERGDPEVHPLRIWCLYHKYTICLKNPTKHEDSRHRHLHFLQDFWTNVVSKNKINVELLQDLQMLLRMVNGIALLYLP